MPFSIRQSSPAEARPAKVLRGVLLRARHRSKRISRLDWLAEANATMCSLNPRYEPFNGQCFASEQHGCVDRREALAEHTRPVCGQIVNPDLELAVLAFNSRRQPDFRSR